MTEKLYRADAYLTQFSSTVLEMQDKAVRLEATAFYPSAGGQAFDTGFLNGLAVLETKEEASEIWHLLDGTLELGQVVTGQINWARRFDHMQQHTGEHLLGQAFFRLGRHVMAVNMEHSVCTLDLEGETTWETALQAESDVCEAIWAALPILGYELPDSEIARVPLRRTPKVSGLIRVVQIGDYDYSACGGTHLANSSQVGMLKIFKIERIKGGSSRVYFNCGRRLLVDYRLKHDFMAGLALGLSTSLEAVPTRIAALQEDFGMAKKQISDLKTQLAQRLVASFHSGIVTHELDDASLLHEVAKICLQRPRLLALLAARDGACGLLAVACGAEVPHNANLVLQIGLPHIGGKGGGKADLAQGSGLNPDGLSAALEAMQAAVRS